MKPLILQRFTDDFFFSNKVRRRFDSQLFTYLSYLEGEHLARDSKEGEIAKTGFSLDYIDIKKNF
jgi:hypothetical protein